MNSNYSRSGVIILAALFASISACAADHQNADHHNGPELVMCPGSTIRARTGVGSISIESLGTVKRRYVISDIDTSVNLEPRKERWNGSFGLFRTTGVDDLHLVLEESILFFDSQRELIAWLEWANNESVQMRYTSDGLVTRWRLETRPEPIVRPNKALHADVFQLLIRGKKPQSIPGSDDAAISVELSDHGCTIGAKGTSAYVASPPKVIGGRQYSGWSIDIMNAHGISPEMVEMAIAGNSPSLKRAAPIVRGDNTTYFYIPQLETFRHGSFVVTVDKSGAVVFMHI